MPLVLDPDSFATGIDYYEKFCGVVARAKPTIKGVIGHLKVHLISTRVFCRVTELMPVGLALEMNRVVVISVWRLQDELIATIAMPSVGAIVDRNWRTGAPGANLDHFLMNLFRGKR